MNRMNTVRFAAGKGVSARPILAPVQPLSAISHRSLGYQFKADAAIFREFEQLKLIKKAKSDNFSDACKAFQTNFLPSTEGDSFKDISLYVKRHNEEIAESEDRSTVEVFFADIEELARAFKSRSNAYVLYSKQQSGKVVVPDGQRFLQVVSASYKRLTAGQKNKLVTDAGHRYNTMYREVSAKYAKSNLIIPQFLNPYKPVDSITSIADRNLWTQIKKEQASFKNQAAVQKRSSKAQKEENKAERTELRAKYNFHEDFTFRLNPHVLFVKQHKKLNPSMQLIDILKNATALKKTLTRSQMSSLERESATMKTAYEAKNKVAAKKAIQNQDWAALKLSEVKTHGTPEDVKMFTKSRREAKKADTVLVDEIQSKEFETFKSKHVKAVITQQREKYNFHKNLSFRSNPYMLYMEQEKMSVRDFMGQESWHSKLSKAKVTALEKESAKLKLAYESQNKTAAVKALADKNWMALKSLEVKKFGTKEDLKSYNRAKKDLEMQISAEFAKTN